MGSRAIKAAGGVTFAQDPKSAQWPAMPMRVITCRIGGFYFDPETHRGGTDAGELGTPTWRRRRRRPRAATWTRSA